MNKNKIPEYCDKVVVLRNTSISGFVMNNTSPKEVEYYPEIIKRGYPEESSYVEIENTIPKPLLH